MKLVNYNLGAGGRGHSGMDLDLNLPLCSKDSICDIHLVIELAPIAFGINDYLIIHFDPPQCLTLYE